MTSAWVLLLSQAADTERVTLPSRQATANHETFVVLKRDLQSGPEVTAACLSCHTEADPIPGLSHASPMVWSSRVYVATAVKPGTAELKVELYGDIDSIAERESHQWRLLAFDKGSGRLVWDALGHEGMPRQRRHAKARQCNSTPATDGKHIVARFGSEGLSCFDARTGHIHYSERLRGANQGFTASPVAAAAKLNFTGELGDVFVLQAGETYAVLATNRLDEICLATPVISEGCLFFRTRGHLVAVGDQ